MRTGVAYLGHHNPRHLRADLEALRALGCDDILLAAQEIDFQYFPGKLRFVPALARDLGLRPVLLLWGALNLFGGGRSSQFLLEHPACCQTGRDGSWRSGGCYNNPACIAYLQALIGEALERGFAGYFIDEPPRLDCFCLSCGQLFAEWFGGDLRSADGVVVADFRRRCVIRYVEGIAAYVKGRQPAAETFCCIPPEDRDLWAEAAAVEGLDNLGTDLYWANKNWDLEAMRPPVRELAGLCRDFGKKHHQWLQCWGVGAGNEGRVGTMGSILSAEEPDALYVWAFEGQVGTSEACADPGRAWAEACAVLRRAKGL
jgi:hypothetical protein